MKVKVTVNIESPLEAIVDVPSEQLNRADFIDYLKETMKQVAIDKSELKFEVIE